MKHLRTAALAAVAVSLLAAPFLTAQGSGGGGSGGGGGYGGSGGRGGGGGEEEGFGNNLAIPIVFAEAYNLLGLPVTAAPETTGLRPLPGDVGYPAVLVNWDSLTMVQKDSVWYYPQQSASHWRADVLPAQAGGEDVILDWGDNLTHQEWTARSVIRVEQVLYRDDLGLALLTYPMTYLFGQGPSEIQGTTGNATIGSYRTVYSVTARLKIEKLLAQGGQVDTTVPAIDSPVYEGFATEGSGYSSEVNVAGKVIYGYNWMLSQVTVPLTKKIGWWRLTFSLDPSVTYTVTPEGGTTQTYTVQRNVRVSALDAGDLADEALFKPIRPDEYTSVLEINVVEKRTGRKPENPGRGGGGGTP